jgi:hypothetical protein
MDIGHQPFVQNVHAHDRLRPFSGTLTHVCAGGNAPMWREQRSHIEVSDAVSGDQLVGALVGDAKDSAGIADGEVFLQRAAAMRLRG